MTESACTSAWQMRAAGSGPSPPHPLYPAPLDLLLTVRRAFHCWARAVGSGTQGAAPTQWPRSMCPAVKPAQAPDTTTGRGHGNGGFLQDAKLSPEPRPIPDPPWMQPLSATGK